MTSVTFDTLAYSNSLQAAGIPKAQADAMAGANATAFEAMINVKQLSTKQDITDLRNELKLDIANSKHEILKWMVTGMVAQAALLVGIIAYLK